MSQKALEALEAERRKILEAQRQCNFCQKRFETAENLARHIAEKHPKAEVSQLMLIGQAIRTVEGILMAVSRSDLINDYGSKPYEALKEFKLDIALDIIQGMGMEVDLAAKQEAAELLSKNTAHFSRNMEASSDECAKPYKG